MKMRCFYLAFGLLLLLGARPARAQAQAALPGYWNLETNLTTRAYTLVRFYDGHDQLVGQAYLPQLCLDWSRGTARCHREAARQLTLALQQVLRDPARAGQAEAALAQQLGQSRRVQRVYAAR